MFELSRSSHALVTGGGRGIGREIAAALSRAGATVTVLGHSASRSVAVAASACALRREGHSHERKQQEDEPASQVAELAALGQLIRVGCH